MKQLLTLLSATLLFSCSQENKITDDATSNKIFTVDIQKMENLEVQEKYQLLKRLYPIFDYMKEPTYWSSKALEDFYFVDIDGDKDLDAIFVGWSGAEPSCVRIFKDNNGAFIKVFEEFIEIDEVKFKGDRLYQMTIRNQGCCAEERFFLNTYEFDIEEDTFKHKLIARSAGLNYNYVPETIYPKTLDFTVKTNTAYIRLQPLVEELDFNMQQEKLTSNIIATYSQKSNGIILAEATNDLNEKWYYVKMSAESNPTDVAFEGTDDFPTSIIGWINSTDIKVKR